MEQNEMMAKIEEWLREVPSDKCLTDEELRESILCPEHIMALYLTRSGIIEKIQLDLLEKIGANNGKEN